MSLDERDPRQPEHTEPTTTTHAPATHTITPNTPTYAPQLKRIALIIVGILAVVLVLCLIILQSLPGQLLYPLKTNVIEELTESTLPTSKGKAAYQVERLKERLDEVKSLNERDTISEEALRELREQSQKHFHILNNIVLESIDSAFPKTEVLGTLNEFASVAGTIEAIAENNPNFGTYGDEAEDIRRETVNLYRDRVESFAATETVETVFAHIQDMLTKVKDELGTRELSSGTVDDAENYLDRVQPAIEGQNFARAITAIGEAYRFIKIEKYGGLQEETTSENATTTENAATSTDDTATSTEDNAATSSLPL